MRAVLWALLGVFVTSAVSQGLPQFRQVSIDFINNTDCIGF